MWLDGIGFATPLEDPTKSKIVGKVGYGVTPKGPKAQHSAIFADGIGIAQASKKKGAAWLYIQWATNKANQTRHAEGRAPARRRACSPFDDPAAHAVEDIPEAVVRHAWLSPARSAAPACRRSSR